MTDYPKDCKECFTRYAHRHEGNRLISPDTDILLSDPKQQAIQAL